MSRLAALMVWKQITAATFFWLKPQLCPTRNTVRLRCDRMIRRSHAALKASTLG